MPINNTISFGTQTTSPTMKSKVKGVIPASPDLGNSQTYQTALRPGQQFPAPVNYPKLGSYLPQPSTVQQKINQIQKPTQGVINTPTNTQSPTVSPSISQNPQSQPNSITSPPNTFTTPNGATVGSGGNLITPALEQSKQSGVRGLFPDIISSLANRAKETNPMVSESYNRAIEIADKLRDSRMNQASAVNSQKLAPIPVGTAFGRASALEDKYLAEQNALSSQLGAFSQLAGIGNTTQQTQNSALQNAGVLATPQLAGYNQQSFNPLTQEFSGGGSLNEAVGNVVKKLQAGQMTYNDAVSALSGYGQGGLDALQKALPQGFNVAQSNTLASQQGSIKPALDYATLALNHAKDTLSGLVIPGQTSNIGVLSDISNWFSNKSGLGKEATRTKEGALAEARSAIQAVLASVRGGNPTEYRDQSYALLPDNSTPSDIDAALANLQTLGQGKVGIYGNPGTSNINNTGENIVKTTAGIINTNW